MLKFVFALALAICAGNVKAENFDSYALAEKLGDVIASEEFCGLSYNQDAIAAFIDRYVPADNMSFSGELDLVIYGKKDDQKLMSRSGKTAHCRQVSRVAKSYGFTR